MQALQITGDTDESTATETIMSACRYNENRGKIHINGFVVTFARLALDVGNGLRYEACMRNAEGDIVALAIIDGCDI